MTERVEKLKNTLKRKPQICINVFKITQETYANMSGEPVELCRAQAMYNILTQIPIFIRDGDLLAGNGASIPGGLEIDIANGIWDEYEIQKLREDGYTFDEKDEPVLYELNRTIPPYGMNDGMGAALDDDNYLMPFMYSGMGLSRWKSRERGRQNLSCNAQGGLNLSPAHALVCLDYETVLKTGVVSMIEDCDRELKHIRFDSLDDYNRCIYIKSMKLTLQGLIEYGKRYADLAEKMAENEQDPMRKKDLEMIAQVCRQVPAYPARNFREALQMYWFIFSAVACPNPVLGMGRLDQLLYPYYKKDMEEGAITNEAVIEYFEILRIKDMELGAVTSKDHRDVSDGEARWHNVVIGGVKPDGEDATNELSYLILDALMECPTLHHTVTIRVASTTPRSLIMKGLECIKAGLSMPAFVGDKSYLKYFELNDVPVEWARDYILTGCLDANLPGKSRSLNCSMFVVPMCLDVFLNDGVDRNTGMQLGHTVGDLDQWNSYEQFLEAFKKEFKYFIELFAQRCNLMLSSIQRFFPEPAKTAFMYRGIEDGVDFQVKKMPFENAGVFSPVGMVNLGNSLMAIKKLVYEKKLVTLSELKMAMDADWSGYETLQRMCLNVEKYGNNIAEVDQIVGDLYSYFETCAKSCPCITGTYYRTSAVSIFAHAPGGMMTGATPDGRFSGETLADGGVSPVGGQDIHGPLAVLKSSLKVPMDHFQAVLFNMKFHPSAFADEKDVEKVAMMIETYFEQGGKHVQFNVCDLKTLQDAQEHPEKHEDLMVRVAGYSAYFVELTKRLQGEIMRRTENESL